MSTRAIKQMLRTYFLSPTGLYVLGLIALGFGASLLIHIYYPQSSSHFFIMGATLASAVASFVFDTSETVSKKNYFDHLVQLTGLTCKTGGSVTGTATCLTGHYRGRGVTLYHHGLGRYLAPSTRIELRFENVTNASLRLRGPIHAGQQRISDHVTNGMISASGLRQVGFNRRFLMGGDSLHLTAAILSTKKLQEKLNSLTQPINIELTQKGLACEQLGIGHNAYHLCFLLDLLSDLADVIEGGGQARLALVAARAN